MKKLFFSFLLFLCYIFSGCTNEAIRDQEKFSVAKKYAIIPFSCDNIDIGIDVSKSLKAWLEKYDFTIIGQPELDTLLSKDKLTVDKLMKNYTLAIGKLKGIDGLIYGYIDLDKKATTTDYNTKTSVGGFRAFVAKAEAYVLDVKTGDWMVKGFYFAPDGANLGGSKSSEEIGKFLSLQLSPH